MDSGSSEVELPVLILSLQPATLEKPAKATFCIFNNIQRINELCGFNSRPGHQAVY